VFCVLPQSKGVTNVKRILALLLAFCCLASAAEREVHWSDLDRLIKGKEVVLRLQEGKQVKGRAVAVSTDSILVQTSTGQRSVPRRALREARIRRRADHKWRMVGALIGAGAGAAVAIPILSETHNEGSGRYDGAAAGLMVGLAALGYLAGWSVDRNGDILRVLPD
jgi:hypothetical protein